MSEEPETPIEEQPEAEEAQPDAPIEAPEAEQAEEKPKRKRGSKSEKQTEPEPHGEVPVIVDRNFNEHRRGDRLILDEAQAALWLEKRLVRPNEDA